MHFLIIGEDRRQSSLARLLQKEHTVSVGVEAADGQTVDAIVLPCPSFDAKGQLKAACSLDTLAPLLKDNKPVFCCGSVTPLLSYPVQPVDLLADEVTVLENARLTAEAALLAVMEHTADSLHKKRCLTVGYGRIGSYLTRLLAAVGAACTVYARREATRALASGFGYRTEGPGRGVLTGYDYVFNTVPAQALSRSELSKLPQTCLWVELASSPGGLPQDGAPFAFSVLPAGGLPGKYLPHAAARVLYDAISRQIGLCRAN